MKEIPLCRPAIGEDEIREVTTILKSGWMAHGPKNHEFEELFGKYLGVNHCVTMNSCTSALHIALCAMNITGEVIVPSFTFVASVNSILLAGATPVFVDIDRATRNISLAGIEKAITPKTQAIMPVHYAGLPAQMPEIIRLAEKHGLRVIEDSAECLGGTYFGKKTGVYDVGCFSFFPTKNITTGEGGMFTTNDKRLADRVRALIAHGIESTTFSRETKVHPAIRIASHVGYNFRLSNVLAAIGVEQMKKVDRLNLARRRLADRYFDRLGSDPGVELQKTPSGYENCWQMFTILVKRDLRNDLLAHLKSQNIGASVHFDPPVHMQPLYKDIRRAQPLVETESVAQSIITLPIYPDMPLEDVDTVSNAIHEFIENKMAA